MNASEPAPSAAKPAFLDRLPEVLSFQLRFLFFRTSREELLSVGWPHFAWGLFATWIAGVGRWWDDDDAVLLQMLGLGSVVYVFVLSALLWIVARALDAPDWTYRRVVTLVMFSSPLAFVYAIPVEMFMSVEEAAATNIRLLGVVALWRVVILFWLLVRVANFTVLKATVATLLPPVFILVALVMLNLHNVVIIHQMGGARIEQPYDPDRVEYFFIQWLMGLSCLASPILFFTWIALVSRARWYDPMEKSLPVTLPPDLLVASPPKPEQPTARPEDSPPDPQVGSRSS